MVTFRWLLLVAFVLGSGTAARGEIVPQSPVFVVNLSDPDRGFSVVSARTFNDGVSKAGDWPPDQATQDALKAGADKDFPIRPATPLERVVGACKSQDGHLPDAVKPIVQRLYACVNCLKAYRETRFQTRAGDHVVLLVLYDRSKISPDQIRPVFRETPRPSELIATARALAGLFRQESQVAPEPSCESFIYSLQRQRSKFTVAVPVPEDARTARPAATAAAAPAGALPAALVNPVAAPTPTAAAAPSSATVLTSPEVTLGPAEHWFFSADFSISSTEVGIGKDPVADEKVLKDKDFFIALNYALADLLPDRGARLQRRSYLKELLIKLEVTPSWHPWEAWALGVGLRGYKMKTILWNMDVIHPYFTVGRQDFEGDSKWRGVVGLGFDPRSLVGDK